MLFEYKNNSISDAISIFECNDDKFRYQIVISSDNFILKQFDKRNYEKRTTMATFDFNKPELFDAEIIKLSRYKSNNKICKAKSPIKRLKSVISIIMYYKIENLIKTWKFLIAISRRIKDNPIKTDVDFAKKYIYTYFYRNKNYFNNIFLLIFIDEYLINPIRVSTLPKDAIDRLDVFNKTLKENSFLYDFLVRRLLIFRYFSFHEGVDNAYSDKKYSELLAYKIKLLEDKYFEIIPTSLLANGEITWFPRKDQELIHLTEFGDKCHVGK